MTNIDSAYDASYSAWGQARTRLLTALLAKIAAETLDFFPEADTLVVEGEHDSEGFFVRAQRVTVGGQKIAGYGSDGVSDSDEWDGFSDDIDSTLLDFLAGLTLEDYAGIQPIDLRAAISAGEGLGTTDAEALDRLNLLLSAAEWPGACGMEDVCQIVRSTGRTEVPNAPEWERH